MIARGSLSETLNHLMDAFDEEYVTEQILNEFREQVKTVEKLLNGYLSWVQKTGK